MNVNKIIKETIDNYLKNNIILNEYLDKEYGMPLYKVAKKELDDANVVKKQWLIHCAWSDEAAESIMKNGFTNGVSKDDISKDTLTNSRFAERTDRGYAWAYKADDLINQKDYGTFEYNKYAGYGSTILFQASGVEYYNDIDDEMQVIFDNKSPQNMILIYEWDGLANVKNKFSSHESIKNEEGEELFGVGNVNGKPLYVNSFENVVKWCIDNFTQYRKYLLSNKTVLHSNYYTDEFQKEYEKYLDKEGIGKLPKNALNLYPKWYNADNEFEDGKYWNETVKEKYAEFLSQHKEEVKKAEIEYQNYLKEEGYDTQDESKLPPWVTAEKTICYEKYGIDYDSFINNFRKKYQYYIRKRPDGEYWKY